MNELKIFKSSQFGEIRTVTIDTEPWFVAVDVCKALEINPNATRRLEDDEKAALRLTQTSSNGVTQERDVIAVNEPGLYSLVLGSRKPEAKAFKRWITHNVIPAIRRTGGYIAGEERMNDDELIAQALLIVNRKLEERTAQLNAANARLEAAQPKIIFADAVAASHTSILVGELAKLLKQNGIDIGQQRLFEQLREGGYLMKTGSSRNMPTQRSLEMKLFEIKERTIGNPDGSVRITRTPVVTGKGQQYFISQYLGRAKT